MPQKILLPALVLVLAMGCGRRASTPTLTGGTWVADREPSVQRITAIPLRYQSRYSDAEEYRNWLHQQVGNTQFEFFSDGTAKCRGGWFNSDRLIWRTDAPGRYWVMTAPTSLPIASVGHGVTLNADGTATCDFQVEWTEGSAIRIPLVLRKRSTP